MTRWLSWLVGITTLVGTGSYLLIYLYRWEWHRALIVGLFFLAAEIAIAAALLFRRLDRLEKRVTGREPRAGAGASDPRVLTHIQQSQVPREPFAWLSRQASSTNVFIPILLGSGVLLSGIAWLVERTVGGAVRGHLDGRLAEEYATIGFPAGSLVPDHGELFAGRSPDGDGAEWNDSALRLLLGPSGGR